MSHNPWPFVVVALGSLGFLANSMAQNNNRFDNFENSTDKFSQRFAENRDSPMVVVREGSPRELNDPLTGLASPFDEPESVQERSLPSAAVEEPWDAFERRTGGRTVAEDVDSSDMPVDEGRSGNRPWGNRAPGFRRSEAASAKITQIREANGEPSSAMNSTFVPRRATETRVAQTPGARQPPLFGTRRGLPARPAASVDETTARPNRRITPQDDEDALFDGGISSTRNTSLLGEKDIIRNLPANPYSSVMNPIKEKPQASQTNPLSVFEKGKQQIEGALESASQQQSVPFWLTLGLFFSLPANLFFGWYAMHMHSRYQDLLEDMQVSSSRLERESRRRRREPREERRPSRSREADEESFLHGGIEV